jgi:WD40 repeat protein
MVDWNPKPVSGSRYNKRYDSPQFISDDGAEIVLRGWDFRSTSFDNGETWERSEAISGLDVYARSADGTVEIEFERGSNATLKPYYNGVAQPLTTGIQLRGTSTVFGDLSDDGSVIILAENNLTQISTDYGQSFASGPAMDFTRIYSVGVSSNGNILAIFTYSQGIFISWDSGSTWIMRPGPDSILSGSAMSADGQNMIVNGHNSGITYASSDMGLTWVATGGTIPVRAYTVRASDDLQRLLAHDYSNSALYYSPNGGRTWEQVTDASTEIWYTAISHNGRWAVAGYKFNFGMRLFIADLGSALPIQTWAEIFIGATPVQELRLGEKLVWQRPA